MKFKCFVFIYTAFAILLTYLHLTRSVKIQSKSKFDTSILTNNYAHFAETLFSERGYI